MTMTAAAQTSTFPRRRELVVRKPGEGDGIWFLDNLLTVKTCGRDGAPYSLAECRLPAGSETPYHRHGDEDEAFYVLEGEITFFTNEPTPAGPGMYVHIPAGVAHGFRAKTPITMLVLTNPVGFVGMVREAGTKALRAELPEAGPPDVERLVRIAARHGIDILGPLAR